MKRINVGLIGYGSVGSGFTEYFYKSNNANLEQFNLAAIGIKDIKKERDFPMTKITTNSLYDIIRNASIDIVVDTVGGDEESNQCSFEFMEAALKHGKHVITANKSTLAQHLPYLVGLAEQHQVNLEYEASVCGSIPIVQSMKDYYINDKITKIIGILNGTSNYILTQMQKWKSYAEALAEARQLRIAEADSSADVNGKDVADKLAILAMLAFGIPLSPKDITIEGIEYLDKDDFFYVRDNLRLRTGKEHTIKLLGIAELRETMLDLRVHPAYIRADHPLYGVDDTLNAVCITGKYGTVSVLKGVGAGSLPTGFAVASDLIRVGKKIQRGIVENFVPRAPPKEALALEHRLVGEHRMTVGYIKSDSPEHKVGILAQKSTILAKHGISIKDWFNFVERETGDPEEIIPDIFLIEKARENAITAALDDFAKQEICASGKVTYLREDDTTTRTRK